MSMKTYTTLRGVVTTFIPYRELSIQNREDVIRDYLSIGSSKTKQKWNITTQTLGHVVFHNKKLLRRIEDENFRLKGL